MPIARPPTKRYLTTCLPQKRKLRTVHHALLPIKESTEGAFKTTGYSIGTNVYARDYRPGHNRWIEGVVTGRHGKVVYDVSVAGEVCKLLQLDPPSQSAPTTHWNE